MAQGLCLSLATVYHGVGLIINTAGMLGLPKYNVKSTGNSEPTSGGSAPRRQTLRMPPKETSISRKGQTKGARHHVAIETQRTEKLKKGLKSCPVKYRKGEKQTWEMAHSLANTEVPGDLSLSTKSPRQMAYFPTLKIR